MYGNTWKRDLLRQGVPLLATIADQQDLALFRSISVSIQKIVTLLTLLGN